MNLLLLLLALTVLTGLSWSATSLLEHRTRRTGRPLLRVAPRHQPW